VDREGLFWALDGTILGAHVRNLGTWEMECFFISG
jgi:hypothetical protein